MEKIWETTNQVKAEDLGSTYCKICGSACVCNISRLPYFEYETKTYSYDCSKCGEYPVRKVRQVNENKFHVVDFCVNNA